MLIVELSMVLVLMLQVLGAGGRGYVLMVFVLIF